MIISDKIKTAFSGLVGFAQSDVLSIVSDANLVTSSGLTFQDASALATIENIHECQNNPNITDAQFNTMLTNMYNDCVLSVCNKVCFGKPQLKHSYNLYPYEKSFNDTITPASRFVCHRIEAFNGIDLMNQISWIELSFDTEKTFNIYLYNSNLKTAIQTKSVTTSAGESKIYNLNWNLSDDATYKGGVFYLGYFEDDLDGAKAYKKDWEKANLRRCNKSFDVHPCEVEYSGTVLNVESVDYSEETWGMNLGINVFYDYTQLLILNKERFATAIQLQMHEKVLNLIKFSTRSNRTERILKDVDLELFGNPEYKIEGVTTKLNKEIETIKRFLFYRNPVTISTLK